MSFLFRLVVKVLALCWLIAIIAAFIYIIGSGHSHAQEIAIYHNVDSLVIHQADFHIAGWSLDCQDRSYYKGYQPQSVRVWIDGIELTPVYLIRNLNRPDVQDYFAYSRICNVSSKYLGYHIYPYNQIVGLGRHNLMMQWSTGQAATIRQYVIEVIE